MLSAELNESLFSTSAIRQFNSFGSPTSQKRRRVLIDNGQWNQKRKNHALETQIHLLRVGNTLLFPNRSRIHALSPTALCARAEHLRDLNAAPRIVSTE